MPVATPNVGGIRDNENLDNVIPNFIYWAMQGRSIPITGTGEETRDFTNVNDLVQGLIKSGYYEDAIGQNFNLASGKEVKIMDLINKVGKAFGKDYKIIIWKGNDNPLISMNSHYK